MKFIIGIIAFIVFVFLGIFLYTWYRLHQGLDIHVSANITNVKRYQPHFKTICFRTSDGIKIAAWYAPVKNAKAVVILLHGYETALGGKPLMLGHQQYLEKAGYSTLLIDFRSVGESKGNKITLGVKEWKDAEAGYDYVKSLPENKNKKIGFLGVSMGAATGINELGLTQKGDFLIASVPFANYSHLFGSQLRDENFPQFIFLPILRLAAAMELGLTYERYDPIKQINKIHVPILLIQAKNDEIVYSNDVKLLYNNADQPKEFWEADTSHDVFEKNPEEFENKTLEFLQKYTQ